MKNVKLLRFRHTPEEVIADLTESEDGLTYKINEPFIPVSNGQGQFGLMPWNFFSNDREFSINVSDILTVTEPVQAMANAYVEQTSKIHLLTPGDNIRPLR